MRVCCLHKHACECAEDEVPDLLVDVDDVGCTLGKSCAGCSKMMPGRDYSRHGTSTQGHERQARCPLETTGASVV